MSSISTSSFADISALKGQFGFQSNDNMPANRSGAVDFAGQSFNLAAQNLSPVQQGELLRGLDQANRQNVINILRWPVGAGSGLTAGPPLPPSVPISPQERRYLQSGTIAGVNAFWQSRFERGDPVAVTARQFGWQHNQMSGSVQIADNMLRSAIHQRVVAQHPNDRSVYRTEYYSVRDGEGGTVQRPRYVMTARGRALEQDLYNRVRVDLANAHAKAIDIDGGKNPRGVPNALHVNQVSKYHWEVFGALGLPASTFGGSPVFGTSAEAWLTSAFGLWGKGYDPN